MAQDDYEGEHVLLQLRECQVYRIPPRTNAAGHYAKDWGELSKPIWIGRCNLTEKGEELFVKLQHDDGRDFAVCKTGPGAIEPVVDSSRYFVLRIEDPRTGKHAFLGMGFLERSQAFDFNAAISDHDKHIRMEKEAAKAAQEYESRPKVDLSLKAPITVSLNISKTPAANKQVSSGILAPPPKAIVFSPARQTTTQAAPAPPKAAVPSDFTFDDDWGDFASASGSTPASHSTPSAAPSTAPSLVPSLTPASHSTPSTINAPTSGSNYNISFLDEPAKPAGAHTGNSATGSNYNISLLSEPAKPVGVLGGGSGVGPNYNVNVSSLLGGGPRPVGIPTAGGIGTGIGGVGAPNYNVSPILGGPRPAAVGVGGVPGMVGPNYNVSPILGGPRPVGVVPGQVAYAGLQGVQTGGVASPLGSPYMGLALGGAGQVRPAVSPAASPLGSPYLGLSPAGSPAGLGGRPATTTIPGSGSGSGLNFF